MDIIFLLGTFITENIILIAKLLAKNAVPGFISLILLMIVVGTTTYFVISTSRKINALKWLKSILSNYSDANFTANIITIDQEINKISSNKYRKQINTAWKEYRETMILHPELSDSQRRAIEMDYGMIGGKAEIVVRKALLFYALKRLGLDTDPAARMPSDQQIILLSGKVVDADHR